MDSWYLSGRYLYLNRTDLKISKTRMNWVNIGLLYSPFAPRLHTPKKFFRAVVEIGQGDVEGRARASRPTFFLLYISQKLSEPYLLFCISFLRLQRGWWTPSAPAERNINGCEPPKADHFSSFIFPFSRESMFSASGCSSLPPTDWTILPEWLVYGGVSPTFISESLLNANLETIHFS